MNIDNMKRLKTHLELEGQKFKYACYVGRLKPQCDDHQDDDDDEWEEPTLTVDIVRDLYQGKCGTVGCLAGMAAAISLVEDNQAVTCRGYDGKQEQVVDVHITGAGWLGLDYYEAQALFMGEWMAENELFGFEDSSDALANATPLDAAKLLQILIDEAEHE